MLGFDQRRESNRTAPAPTVIARFAGFDFELDGPAALCARFVRAARDHAPGGTGGARAAVAPKFEVGCRVEALRAGHAEPPQLSRAGIAWDWGSNEGYLWTRFGQARVERRAGRFTARIHVSEGRGVQGEGLAPRLLLSGLTALVAHQLGGGILHAASVELDSDVVAFVGPSGSGKSTACRHVDDCPLFSADTLAVVPGQSDESAGRRSVWLCHPLPGGTRPVPNMASAARRWLPLRAVLRVHRSETETSLSDASPAAAVALLRESAFQMGIGVAAEHELLAALERLSQAARVGRLQLRLGAFSRPILGRWLSDQFTENFR